MQAILITAYVLGVFGATAMAAGVANDLKKDTLAGALPIIALWPVWLLLCLVNNLTHDRVTDAALTFGARLETLAERAEAWLRA